MSGFNARAVRAGIGFAVLGAAVGTAATFALRGAGRHFPLWYLGVLGAVAVLGVRVLRPLLLRMWSPNGLQHGPQPPRHATVPMLEPLEWQLEHAARDGRVYATTVRPLLTTLTRDRLWHSTRVDLDGVLHDDPTLARRLLGDELWHWLTTPDGTPGPTRRDLDRLLNTIETL